MVKELTAEERVKAVYPNAVRPMGSVWETQKHFDAWWNAPYDRREDSPSKWLGYLGYDWNKAASRLPAQVAAPQPGAVQDDLCHVCGEVAIGTCESCEKPVCDQHEGGKWHDVYECKEEVCGVNKEKPPAPQSESQAQLLAANDGVSLIAAERQRQVSQEGWSAEHDAEHLMGEMIGAAITYAGHALEIVSDHELPNADTEGYWPWDEKWWKPSPDPIRNLVKAGALIAAEIDRLSAIAQVEAEAAGRTEE